MAIQIKPTKHRRVVAFILTGFGILLIFASLLVVIVGVQIRKDFQTELPESFFGRAATGRSPQFFCYCFDDRTNRIGTEMRLDDAFFSQKSGTYASYTELPQHLKDAFIAIEDKRFFEHRGVDWYRTVAASANYLLGFSDSFGASTVTQQLVKNLTGNTEATPKRKLQEILYALEMERRMDKTQIFEIYLNVIHFAEQCDGIGEAAEHYFSKLPQELTLTESATLAAIINNPSYYNPVRNPQNNLARRNLILDEMQRQGRISEMECETAKKEPVTLRLSNKTKQESTDSWYADMVIDDVIHDLKEKYGLSTGAASALVYSGGLQIYTAIDQDIQAAVERYYQAEIRVPVNENGVQAQSALIVIDSHTGDILGVAGAVGKKQGNRLQNFATQTLRPPGSTLKPISVYAPALERGLITWASVFDDVPLEFSKNGTNAWPKNAGYGYRGLTDVSYAIAESTNTVSVKILQKLGINTSFETAKKKFHLVNLYDSGSKTDRDVAALALGQLNYGVTLRELASAYSVFADDGIYHPYRSYYRVLDAEGNILLSAPDGGEEVMSRGNAAVMTKLMQGVVENGSASSIKLKRQIECAGKTGTTNADADRWFIGYTPDLICGVWCGYEYPEPLEGKNVCLKIWDDVMQDITKNGSYQKCFSTPSSLVRVSYCKDSGKCPCEACTLDPRGNRIATGWFVKGSEPKETCDCHIVCNYDAEHGGICHGSCPAQNQKQVALIRVDRDIPNSIIVADAQYVYGGDPLSFPPNENTSQAYFQASQENSYGHSYTALPFNRSCTAHPPDFDTRITDWYRLVKKE